ncbi:MAG: Uma2 family endonuclease [Ardenticatenales bacterium]|jgi:Uma2 family endonuclease|nr:Uma2 family endonuclease [Ardenticatenales bacterium]
MITRTKLMTAEELAAIPDLPGRSELVRGEYIEMSPGSGGHGFVAARVAFRIAAFIEDHSHLGRVYAAETGFVLFRNPDTVRGPDASFLSFPRADHPLDQAGFIEGPPDLAVEVVSPNDTERYVAEKVADYLGAGTPLVWVVRPRKRTVTVHDASGDVRVLGEGEVLDGGDVLPGFEVEVGRLFA